MSHNEVRVEPVEKKRDTYISLNAELEILDPETGLLRLESDKKAARAYFLEHVNQNTVFHYSLAEKLDYLTENDYYETEVLDKYDFEFIKSLFKKVYGAKHRFDTFLGALKYYKSYTLKTFDGEKYLERFEDRVAMTALYLGNGDEFLAESIAEEIISGRFQPATPTFLNAGKKQRGEMVSCFLLRVEDNMESISRSITSALQLSKRGGGVAFNLTNIRESGAPIKKIQNQSSGVVPIMKLLEDSFSYANQLGARQGAGAVYLNAHHPDIYNFLDTKRENADEKVRIKTLSLGVVIPDITMELVKTGEPMYLFSPYDVERVYGQPFSEMSITEHYYDMVKNPEIRKKKIDPRELLQTIASLQFESGYPYILFEDTANRSNPIDGKVSMSNLCSEILQVSKPSTYNSDGTYKEIGKDISCNLGSLNVAKAFDSPNFSATINSAVRALTTVSELSDISSVPSIEKGNQASHAIGLGQMNLHGFFGREHIHYDSPEALDFTNVYFLAVLYEALKASNQLAVERGVSFGGFENSAYADGTFFDKYIEKDWGVIKTEKVKELMARSTIHVPTVDDWKQLKTDVMTGGLYNQNLQAVPPTGSISYINGSTSSIHPITRRIEIRKEGSVGRVYYPAPHMTNENLAYFKTAYEIGPKAIIDLYAVAQEHVDQGLSLTTFYTSDATTRDVISSIVHAWKQGVKTLYYVRVSNQTVNGAKVAGTSDSLDINNVPKIESAGISLNGPLVGSDDEDGDECESCVL